MRRVNGKLVRDTVGLWPECNVDTARKKAAAMLVSMEDGVNPNIDTKHKRTMQADQRGVLSNILEAYISAGGSSEKRTRRSL